MLWEKDIFDQVENRKVFLRPVQLKCSTLSQE